MPPQDDEEKVASLESTNAALRASLKRCRALLADYRARLTANSNDPPLFRWNEERKKASRETTRSSEPTEQ